MIKKLFFITALLVPGLAYAGSPSADLSVQVVPAESNPAAPTPAAAAGFTTLAANFDFVNNRMCVGSICVAASPTSNWLDYANNDITKPWHCGANGVANSLPCNIFITTDAGKQVLDQQYLASYASNNLSGNANFVAMDNLTGQTLTFSFPNNFYWEAVYRIDAVYPGNGNSSGPNGGFVWSVYPPNIGATCVNDFELAELYGGNGGYGNSSSSGWCPTQWNNLFWQSYNSSNVNLPSRWAPTQYHKYGGLRTSDGRTSIKACNWVDDLFQTGGSTGGCLELYQGNNTVFQNRSYIISWVGSNGISPSYQADYPQATTNLLIQYYRIWTCANPSGQCDGASLTDNGQGLRYWH
jgi:hypothetical protein